MLSQAVLAAAERSIALAVSRDPLTARRLGALDGKVIRIQARTPDFTLYLLPAAEGITLLGRHADLEPDCSLSAPVSMLARLATSSQRKQLLEDPSVELSGDTQVLVDLQNIFGDLRLDSEAELARWIGPVAAHAIGQFVRTGRGWASSTRSSLDTVVKDYLTEETRHLVGRREADSAAMDIHELRLRLDRLEARLNTLDNPPADAPDA
ncbi:SCP2 sterol-binding domain-containing protein [Halopseudomonas nanhaiensis]|uniref:ubiquinone biosynthesis accessory factor UbiJ n=1 Tax=Halopseudomonas nanhaiensis TaxID=2830842 RepID=UPI001CBA9A7C|nr:SCP2 sterol-binding domain-containing protein [Halopseudomonas nanhaiensis]UAW98185.1 SCP2 sterol-binding domain-containing protein [Halopseudomonas nanhaiensis]